MKMWSGRKLSSDPDSIISSRHGHTPGGSCWIRITKKLLDARSLHLLLAVGGLIAFTARPKRNRSAVGTGPGMAEEAANLVCGFGREYVFALARLLLDLRFAVESQAVRKEPLGQAVAANDVGGAEASARREFHDHAAVARGHAGGLQRIVAGVHKRLVIMHLRRMRPGGKQAEGGHLIDCDAYRQRAMNFHALDFGNFSVLLDRP